jgi:hypothetical protein
MNRGGQQANESRLVKASQRVKKSSAVKDATDFLQCVVAFKDPLEVVSLLVDHKDLGIEVLKRSLSVVVVENTSCLLEFLEFLGLEKLSIGSAKLHTLLCYKAAFKTPGLLGVLEKNISSRTEKEKATIAWFLVAVCRDDADARANPTVIRIAEALSAMEGKAIQAMMTLILPSSGGSDGGGGGGDTFHGRVSNLEELRALEPQHDNDFPLDYRSIQIVPTADEINHRVNVPTNFGKITSEAGLLDRQFRLLRDDMLGPILEEIDAHIATPGKNKRAKIFQHPVLVDVVLEPVPCVLMAVPIPEALQKRLKEMTPAAREHFCMDDLGKRILARDSLLVFFTDLKVKCVARVVRKDKREFLSRPGYFLVGVGFETKILPTVMNRVLFDAPTAPPVAVVTPSMQPVGQVQTSTPQPVVQSKSGAGAAASGRKADTNGATSTQIVDKKITSPAQLTAPFSSSDWFCDELFQASSSIFSCEPVLKRLQQMTNVPFCEELVAGSNPLPLRSPVPVSSLTLKALKDDPNQLEAVRSSLSRRLSLIQGPPGTGKTYVGVQIVRALVDNMPARHQSLDEDYGDSEGSERILCLCYTNHALDDFLLSLHHDGRIPLEDIIRLGRSPKIHQDLQRCCFGASGANTAFNRLQTRKFATIKSAMASYLTEIGKIKSKLNKTFKHSWGAKASWGAISAAVENSSLGSAERDFLGSLDAASWKSWCNGVVRQGEEYWSVKADIRKRYVEQWQAECKEDLLGEFVNYFTEFVKLKEELDLLQSESKIATVASVKIIGCTTTSAAKNQELLEQFRPTVVIVEEAGEILEASVLTSLTSSVKHLVMVGDHKQLRPKLEKYQLRKESGSGIDFDVSLFERLALQLNFPVLSLTEQRRMRPEICDLIRLSTYPSLKDHPSVRNRDNIRGISNNIVFIDHNNVEGTDADGALLGTNSKINTHEVMMVKEMVNYFILQGYEPEDIVILTPYLGQLVRIQAELRKLKLAVDINDLDRSELANADISLDDHLAVVGATDAAALSAVGVKATSNSEHSTTAKKVSSVRVATVDNFQGEESKLVICSLVRCNAYGDIGFVAGSERVNVMLSRARDGMVLIGSSETLRSAKVRAGTAPWKAILDHLEKRGMIFPGFPAICTTHSARPDEAIDTPAKFAAHVPCGGCTRDCDVKLPMCPLGHVCPKKCHPRYDPVNGADVHSTMQCCFMVESKCPLGHSIVRVCSSNKSEPCRQEVDKPCAAGLHFSKRFCYMEADKSCFPCKNLAKKKAKEAEELRKADEAQKALLELRIEERDNAHHELLQASQEASHLREVDRVKRETELARSEVRQLKEDMAAPQIKVKEVKNG